MRARVHCFPMRPQPVQHESRTFGTDPRHSEEFLQRQRPLPQGERRGQEASLGWTDAGDQAEGLRIHAPRVRMPGREVAASRSGDAQIGPDPPDEDTCKDEAEDQCHEEALAALSIPCEHCSPPCPGEAICLAPLQDPRPEIGAPLRLRKLRHAIDESVSDRRHRACRRRSGIVDQDRRLACQGLPDHGVLRDGP